MENIKEQIVNIILSGDTTELALLLKKGDYANVKVSQNDVPIHYAVKKENLEIVSLLLENGADPNAINDIGVTSLWMLIFEMDILTNIDMIKILLKSGANPNFKQRKNDWSFLHQSVYDKQIELTKLLLEYGANPIESVNADKWSPLHLVRDVETANILLGSDAKKTINSFDKEGLTPIVIVMNLINSGMNANTVDNIVEVLLENGANIEEDNMSFDILEIAIMNNLTKTVKSFIKKEVNIKKHNNYGLSPILQAASYGYDQIVRTLIEAGADPNDQQPFDGWTPIFYSVVNSDLEVIKVLLDNGASLDIKDSTGKNVFEYVESDEVKNILTSYLDKEN